MDSADQPEALSRRQLYPLLYAFYGAPCFFVLPLVASLGSPADNPPVFAVVIIALWLAGAFLAAETFGYRTTALPTDLPPEDAARIAAQRFRVTLMMRLAIAESPILVALVFAFVFGNVWIYVFALVLGLPMMIFVSWPGARTVDRVRAYLEAEGARSFLPS